MIPPIVSLLPPATQARFRLAYTTKSRPIGMGEPDDIAIGMIQAWLNALDIPLPKSTTRNADGTITADGVYGSETYGAVKKFQGQNSLKQDGMVGHDTIDKISEKLAAKFNRPVHTEPPRNASVNVVKRPFRCPPGALICPEPSN